MILLEKHGLRWQGGVLEDNAKQITHLISQSYADEFVLIWKIHEEIRFGAKEPNEAVCGQFYDFLQTTKDMLKSKKNSKSN